MANQGPGHGNALAFAPGKGVRTMGRAGLQAHRIQHGRCLDLGFAAGGASQAQRHEHILQGGELRQQVMELVHESDVTVAQLGPLAHRCGAYGRPAKLHLPGIQIVQPGQDVQQGALPRSGTPDNGASFAGPHFEAQAAQHVDALAALLERLVQACGQEHRLTHGRARGWAAGEQRAKPDTGCRPHIG